MKYIELKDLCPGQELILAWKDDYLEQYYPFNVKVEKINTVNNHPKKRRVGRYTGMTNKYKKAIVKLAEGSTISFD